MVAISAAIIILLKNINPAKTISYIIVLVFFPFLGILVYYLFGQEYRKTKIFNRKGMLNRTIIKNVNDDFELGKAEFDKIDAALDEKIKLVKLLKNSEDAPLTLKNQMTVLKNGEVKFKQLLKDLKAAKHHIHLEYYILKDDHIGSRVLDIICEKASKGLEVRFTYDDVGSSLSASSKKKLKESGVQFYPFMPVLFSGFTGKMNYRNHRKIAIIDGKIAYVGGINISDNYINSETKRDYWRDTHLRISGDAVKSLQIQFLTTWDFVSDEPLKITSRFFPELEIEDNLALQIAASGPDSNRATIMEAIFTAITTAEDYIYITTPYFIPNPQIFTALQVASKSDIDVRLIIPKDSDSWAAEYATNSFLEPLLEAGVKVYRYHKGFIHAKTMVVDDLFSTVGTSNMDNRSFNINFEINALIYDRKQSKVLKSHFLQDIKDCELVNYKQWQERPGLDKLKESFSRLWAPLL
ncbi:cardiolipin synthase [Flavobacteriaceae bacterium MAR_2010_105]|nr:cardiolipin synthase [Flavobacteriaceae bacterium MAR_2010_105]